MLRTDAEGRIRINPIFAWGILTYLLGIALVAGMSLAELSATKRELMELRSDMKISYRTRVEGDAINLATNIRIDALEHRVIALEEHRGRTP